MFYNELDVLELRLQCLDHYVDFFVLVEAEVNHVGGKKECFYLQNKERYLKWSHKIIHVIVSASESPKDKDPWSREKYQRSCILKGLKFVPLNAHVMISDVDEIPDLSRIKPCDDTFSCHMTMFEYSFKYIFTGEPWVGTVCTPCYRVKEMGVNYFRDTRWKFPTVKNAGWHLSSFGNAAHVVNKMHTFAHGLDGHHEAQTAQLFQTYIEQGLHTDGKNKLVLRPDTCPLPASLDDLKRLHLL